MMTGLIGDSGSFLLEENLSNGGSDATTNITEIQKSQSTLIVRQNEENIRNESLPLNISVSDMRYGDEVTSLKPSGREIEGHQTIDLIIATDEKREFELGSLLEKPDSHKFYCPNCNACIEKIFLKREVERLRTAVSDLQRREQVEATFTCTSCYSFLVFIGIMSSHPCLEVTIPSSSLIFINNLFIFIDSIIFESDG